MVQKACMHCFVSGKVQGVWYRASTKDVAQSLCITGWAKNMDDGRVEVMACGQSDALNRLYDWLHEGSKLAKVDEVIREDLAFQPFENFNTY